MYKRAKVIGELIKCVVDGGAEVCMVLFTDTGSLSEGHEWTEDAVEVL